MFQGAGRKVELVACLEKSHISRTQVPLSIENLFFWPTNIFRTVVKVQEVESRAAGMSQEGRR